ncbi:MAG: helical backbone metal receptor [Phycisphaerales bacterium]|jgi:iron complex transport system substrate-binding protein
MMKKLPYIIFGIVASIIVIAVFFKYRTQLQAGFDENQQLEKNKPPQRIVSLAPNITEILFALGLGDKVIAVSNDCDYPAAALEKNKVGPYWQPNTESVISCRPDLVITLQTKSEHQKSILNSLKRMRFNVLPLKLETIEELLAAIKIVGSATDCRQRAEELAKNISERLNNLEQALSSTDKVKVMWVVQVEPLRVAGRNTFINELIELAGGENAVGPTIAQYPSLSSEDVLICGAQVIIQSAMGTDDILNQQQASETFWGKFKALPAVKNNRIYVIEPDTTLRLGPRLPQGAETIARCLHPDNFRQTYKIK